MDVSQYPLTELRRRLDSAADNQATWLRLVAALRADSRRGARAMAASAVHRALARRAEERRVDRMFSRRRQLFREGVRLVAGVDEVGVGPLAGPVVAAAVVLPETVDLPGLDDSKRLTPEARERLATFIHQQAVAVAVAQVSREEIDRMNILRATLEAMRRAVLALDVAPDHVLVDARRIPGIEMPQTPVIGGDREDGSIAAASIVAKVYRDAIMRRLHRRYPGYGFERHKGYGTREHLAALRSLGPTPAHRRSFSPVSQLALRD